MKTIMTILTILGIFLLTMTISLFNMSINKEFSSDYNYIMIFPSGRIDSLYQFYSGSECNQYVIVKDKNNWDEKEYIYKGKWVVKSIK